MDREYSTVMVSTSGGRAGISCADVGGCFCRSKTYFLRFFDLSITLLQAIVLSHAAEGRYDLKRGLYSVSARD